MVLVYVLAHGASAFVRRLKKLGGLLRPSGRGTSCEARSSSLFPPVPWNLLGTPLCGGVIRLKGEEMKSNVKMGDRVKYLLRLSGPSDGSCHGPSPYGMMPTGPIVQEPRSNFDWRAL